MKNGCLYIRVSTDDQLELSPDAQERLLLEYAHKNDILVSKEHIFHENGISGRKADKRPAFQQMIALAKSNEHPIDVILVWKFSRFARNQEESIVYKSLLKRNNVDVVSISEPLPDGMIGSLVERIFEWMDEYYSINLSVEVTRGMTENALRGGYQGSMPFGYIHTGHKEVPVIDEEQARIVREVFDMFLNGSTFTQIARWLNNQGVKSTRGGKFENRTVRYMLQNPFYVGKVRWNYYDRKNSKYKSTDEVIIADGKHEPIISQDVWDGVQAKINTHIREYKPRDVSTCKHWLSGMVQCSSCGASLGYCKSGHYFNCYKYTKGLCEHSHFITEKSLVENVIAGIETKLDSRDFYDVHIVRTSDNSSQIDILRKKIDKLNIRLIKAKDAYMDGIDSLEEYKENKTKIQKEIESLQNDIVELSSAKIEDISNEELVRKMTDSINASLSVIKDENSDYVEKGNALRRIVEKIVYDKENNSFSFMFYLSI